MHLYANDLISASSAITQVYTLIAFHQLKSCCSKLEVPQKGLQEEYGYENNGIGNLEDDSFLFCIASHSSDKNNDAAWKYHIYGEVTDRIYPYVCTGNLRVRKVSLKVRKEFFFVTWRKTLKKWWQTQKKVILFLE